jgi:NAD(P)-dependent dehydrogenase (short-subunit alcohol dehydrogenase family)
MAKWTEASIPDLKGKRALVTGAASGLGFQVAAALAHHGATVILADRNVEGGRAAIQRIREQTPGSKVEFRELDLAELAFIRRFAAELAADGQPLDILVNNAGILPPLTRRTTKDGFELKFGINYLGHFALTGLLLEALLRSKAPRVVGVASLVQAWGHIDFDDLQAERSYDPERAYNQAKLACLMFALELQERSKAAGSRLTCIAAHPGIARTSIGEGRRGQPRTKIRDWLSYFAFQIAMNVLSQTPELGALPILYAATSPEAVGGGFYGPDGFGQISGYPKRVKPSAAAQDAAVRRRLWEVSEKLTGVRYDGLKKG